MRSLALVTMLAAGLVSVGAGPGPPDAVDPYFRDAPELILKSTGPLAVVSVVRPTLFGPASGPVAGGGRRAVSFYICGVGQLHEVRMDTGEVIRHEVPFDSSSRAIYSQGVGKAWLGTDGKIYLGMAGKPARVGRFDPATRKMELLGELAGHTVMRVFVAPGLKCYVITYPATLSEIDMARGRLRTIGRLADDALYVHGRAWIGEDGAFYCTAGQRPGKKVRADLQSGKIEVLETFPEVKPVTVPEPETFKASKRFTAEVRATGDRAVVTFGPTGSQERRTVTFKCSTVARDMHSVAVGPDGKIYGCGSYNNFIFDPATGRVERPVFHYNCYDYLAVGAKLYFGGYPNARVGAYDTARPIHIPDDRNVLWRMRAPRDNPYEVVNIYNVKGRDGNILKMKRSWTLVQGADGLVYIGCSATRQNRGGCIVVLDPKTERVVDSLRKPFRLLGVSAMCAIGGRRQIGIVTWVSPDPNLPGQEPEAARLFVYDVAGRRLVLEATPMPDHKVLTAVIHAPGTRRLVGVGLRGVTPTPEMDDAFYGNGELFFFHLEAKKTLKRIPFDFPISRREGRPIAAAPDGTLWVSGGGGIIRIDPQKMTAEPGKLPTRYLASRCMPFSPCPCVGSGAFPMNRLPEVRPSSAEADGSAAEAGLLRFSPGRFLRRRWHAEAGYRELLAVAIPLILSTSAWSVQHFVDRMFLTWHSEAAVAAAMPAGMLSFTFLTIFLGTAGYTSTFVAQYDGAGRPHRIGSAVWQGVYIAAIAGLFSACLIPLARPLFELVGHERAVLENEIVYFRVLCLGAGPAVASAAMAGFFSGRGRTWPVMWVNVFATVVNLVADYALIFGKFGFPEMGMRGAAIATVLSGFVAFAVYAVLLARPHFERTYRTRSGWRPDRVLFGRLIRFGLPGGIQFFLDLAGFTFFIVTVGTLGVRELAATNIAFNINTLAFMPMIGVGTAVSVLVGRSLGRDRPDLAERGAYSGFHLTMTYMASIAAAYILLPDLFVAPFAARVATEDFETTRSTVIVLLRFVALYSLFDAFNVVFAAAIRGAGDTRYVMVMLAVVSGLVLVAPSYVALIVLGGGLYTAWTICAVYVMVLALAFFVRFRGGKWKSMRVIEKAPPSLPPAVSEAPTTEFTP